MGNVHKSHLIKHKALKSECRQRREGGFLGRKKHTFGEDTVIKCRFVYFKEIAKYRGTKDRAVILPSLGQTTIHKWCAISEYAAVILLSPELKKR